MSNMNFVFSPNAVIPEIIPQIITQDLFPNIYALNNAPTMNFEDLYSIGTYDIGLPSTVTQYVDPAIITGPQTYEYKYTNQNGVDVVLRGTYNNVMSTVDVLNTYPPIKKPCNDTSSNSGSKREYFEIYGPGSTSPTALNPAVDTQVVGTPSGSNFINVKIDGKVYSGSGSLIMVVEQGKSLNDAKFVLLRDTNGQYQDLGGKIDKPAANTAIDKNILFINAKKETEEESMKLFNLTKPSSFFVDVESTIDNTYYRVYLYLFVLNNINQLAPMYEANKMQVLTNFPHMFNDSYKETNMLGLFDYNTLMSKLSTYNPSVYNTSSGVFQTTTGQPVNIRGRTMRVIAKLQSDNKFIDLLRNNKVNTATVTYASGGTLFNSITL